MTTLCHSLSFVVTCCCSFSLLCHLLYHLLSLVILSLLFAVIRWHSLSLVVTRCIPRQSFNKRFLKSKTKVIKLQEFALKTQPIIIKLNENSQERNKDIKSINLQLGKQGRNYIRNSNDRVENNLKKHKDKIKK